MTARNPTASPALGDRRFDAVVDMSAYFSDWTRAAADGADRAGRPLRLHLERRGLPTLGGASVAGVDTVRTDSDLGRLRPREGRLRAPALGRSCRGALRGDGVPASRSSSAPATSPTGSRSSSAGSTTDRPILLPGGGSALNQFVYADDVARAIVATLERPEVAGGQAYNCLHPRPITNRGWVELCADVLGVDAEIVSIDESELGVAAETVDLTNIVFPYPAEHYVLDGSKLVRELGIEMATGNRRMIEEYAAWWESLAEKPPLRGYERENAALSRLGLPTV